MAQQRSAVAPDPVHGDGFDALVSPLVDPSLVQAAKARGYRTVEHLITITYLLVGKLDFNASHIRKRGTRNPLLLSSPLRLGVILSDCA